MMGASALSGTDKHSKEGLWLCRRDAGWMYMDISILKYRGDTHREKERDLCASAI